MPEQKKKPKLHEVLAVEGDLENTAKKVIAEAADTFRKKPDHFIAVRKNLVMYDEDRKREETHEAKELVTTVDDKLKYVVGHVARYWDAFARKERTNQEAKADVVVNGETLLSDVPACALLGLETKLKGLRDMYEAIPTLQPGVAWELDEGQGKGVYRAKREEKTFKTEKVKEAKVITQATKEFPAQVDTWSVDKPIGEWNTDRWCSMITPLRKSVLLGRIDDLIRGVKRARQRANATEVVEINVGEKLLKYINEA